jgi:hypothetical protein
MIYGQEKHLPKIAELTLHKNTKEVRVKSSFGDQ